MCSNKTFMYFAYGSNLLQKRIHINNPSAKRAGIGKLNNYRLDFIRYSTRWRGASATIVPCKGSSVWGAIWEIDMKHMESLDDQEGVTQKVYFPLMVDVESPDGGLQNCRVYQQHQTPEKSVPLELLPHERQPSAVYLNTIVLGAKESQIPQHYQDFLSKIAHNGYDGNVDIDLDLNIKS